MVEATGSIPSNIMLKKSYPLYINKHSHWMDECIKELYGYIYYSTKEEDLANIEIEIRLGKFHFIGEHLYCLNLLNDTFKVPQINKKDPNNRIEFAPGLDRNLFFTLWYYVDKESQLNKEILRQQPRLYKEILYQSGKRRSIFKDNNGNFKEETILKDNKYNINIRNNSQDFRISASIENKTEIMSEDLPKIYREKFRISYKFRFFRLDFTIVTTDNNFNELEVNSNPLETMERLNENSDVLFDVEFEFDDLKKVYQLFTKFEDFSYLMQRYIQNIFCLYETMSLDYYILMIENAKKPKSDKDSIFGNYLENNLFN